MNSMVVRFLRWMSVRSSVTAACTETSSAETGSSATTTAGIAGEGARDADALLLAAGELARLAEGEVARQLHQVEQLVSLAARSPAGSFATAEFLAARARSGAPTEWLGLSVSNGFWNTICRLDDQSGSRCLHRQLADLDAVEEDLALGRRSRAPSAPWRRSTCRSPTRRRSPPSRASRASKSSFSLALT